MGTWLCHQGRLFNFCFVKCFRKCTVCGVRDPLWVGAPNWYVSFNLSGYLWTGLNGAAAYREYTQTHSHNYNLTHAQQLTHTHHFLLQRYWTTQNNFFWGRGRLWMIGTHDRGHQRPIRSNFNFRPKMIKSQFRNFFFVLQLWESVVTFGQMTLCRPTLFLKESSLQGLTALTSLC